MEDSSEKKYKYTAKQEMQYRQRILDNKVSDNGARSD